MIKEYGDLKPGDISVVVVLAEREVTNCGTGRTSTWKLKHHTAGWECAGSVARSTVEKWTVTSHDPTQGTTHGNAFLSEPEARTVFDSDKPWYKPPPTPLKSA